MKKNQKDLPKLLWEQMSVNSKNSGIGPWIRKVMGSLIALICITYMGYSLNLLLNSHVCWHCTNECTEAKPLQMIVLNASKEDSNHRDSKRFLEKMEVVPRVASDTTATDLKHIVFGIAASASLWEKRKEYTKLWWRPKEMRGFVWLDKPVKSQRNNKKEALALPPLRISSSTSRFKYTNKQGHRSAIRISRIISETFRLGLPDVHWFVMGDDDTVFIADNLVRVLSKYDHRRMYYIGSLSESHLQNIYLSYNMAYGGGGFAISYPLAKALESMQDGCIQRYPGLYGSDDRMQACMSELGVPLTKEPGFHQYDIYGNLFGLLAAHPVTPLVSLHHLDIVEPIFPNLTRVQALQHLSKPIKLDSAGILQQSICYDRVREWSFSVSWGYAIQIFRGIFSPRELEMPSRTFLNWYKRADFTAYAFNTRPVTRHPCQKPFVFYMKDVNYDTSMTHILSNYTRQEIEPPQCRWKMDSPENIDWIQVVKKTNSFSEQQSPRRNCCRVISSRNRSIDIEVGKCKEGEIIGL
eukprot:Gb_10284 [translate_table: standard]